MTNPIHRIYQEDGSFIDRPFTEKELAQALKDKAETDALIQANAEAEAKRQSALAKLAALGLEEDDLKALGL
jgi:FixJ family two-component response regulator